MDIKYALFIIGIGIIGCRPIFNASKTSVDSDVIHLQGTYKLNENESIKEEPGAFGEIRVKQLKNNQVGVAFSFCKGHPSYNLGSFLDTLSLIENKAIYRSEFDSTCQVESVFLGNLIQVTQTSDFGCGFGHGVYCDGQYIRTSTAVPDLEGLLNTP